MNSENIASSTLPRKIRYLAAAAGCFFAGVSFLFYGFLFLILPAILVLGAVVQPALPRLGKLLLALGACFLTVYVTLPTISVISLVRDLQFHHGLRELGFLFLWLASAILIFWCDVALIVDERKLRARATGGLAARI